MSRASKGEKTGKRDKTQVDQLCYLFAVKKFEFMSESLGEIERLMTK